MTDEKQKTKKWPQKFRTEYSAQWPCMEKSDKGIYHAFCTICSANISVEHGGRDCIRRHVESKRHRSTEIAKSRSTSSSTWMKYFTKPGTCTCTCTTHSSVFLKIFGGAVTAVIGCCLLFFFLYLVYEFSPYVSGHATSFMEWLREQVSLRSPAVILLTVSVTVLRIVFGVGMYSDLCWNRRFMTCLLISIFVISFIWNWIGLYQEEVTQRFSDAQRYRSIPANCMPEMTLVQAIKGWFTSMISILRDECFEYHRIYLVDPLFDVPPTRALSFTVSSLFVDSIKYFGRAVNEFHVELFTDLSILASLSALGISYVCLFIVSYMVYAYFTVPRRVLTERQRTIGTGSYPGTELTDFPNDNR